MQLHGVHGIIWDLDGTLLDSFGVFETIIADMVKESGHIMPSRAFMLENYHGSLADTIGKILAIQSPAELDETVARFVKRQMVHYGNDLETHLFQDAVHLAGQAASKGVHQLVLTNRDHAGRGTASPRHIIAATTLADYIHEVLPGDEVAYRKPDARSLGDWMDRFELQPDGVVVIGDQYVDAQLAINIGARALLIQRGEAIPHLEKLPTNNTVVVTTDLRTIDLAG